MKSYPSQISVNQLAELTGRDRRTLSRLLEGAEADEAGRYDIREAIRLAFEFFPDEEGGSQEFNDAFQPKLEKSKLDYVKRKDLELDMDIKRRELVPRDEIKSFLHKIFGAVRARILAIPTKAAQQIHANLTQKQIEALLKKMCDEALTDLSEKKINGRIG